MSRRKNTSVLNLGKNKDWISSWYIHKNNYSSFIQKDLLIYIYLRSKLFSFFKDSIFEFRVCRMNKNLVLSMFVRIKNLLKRKLFFNLFNDIVCLFKINTFLVLSTISLEKVFLNASHFALKVALLLEKRIRFRSKFIKLLLKKIKKSCKGIYIECKGRMNNVDMARNDKMQLGFVPLQSLKEYISYGLAIANTSKGLQSIKVLICR